MSYSRTGLPHSLPTLERNFLSAPIQTGVPLLDQDINLMQRIGVEQQMDMFRFLFRAGWLTISEPDPLADYTGLGENVLTITPPQHFIFNGMSVTFAETETVSNQITIPSTSEEYDPVYDGDELPLSVLSTHGDDLLFLEFWFEELDEFSTIYRYGNVDHYLPSHFSNDIIDPAVGDPAAVRIQLRYRLRIVKGANDIRDGNVYIQGKKSTPDRLRRFAYDSDNNIYYNDTTQTASVGEFDDYDGFVYATPICWIERTISDDDIANATIHDQRTPASHKISQFGASVVPGNPGSPGVPGEPAGPPGAPGDPGEPGGPGGGPSVEDCRSLQIIGQWYSRECIDPFDGANTVTVSFCHGNVHFIDLAEATTDVTLTLEEGKDGGVYYLIFKQHPTTPVQVIFPIDVDWVNGTGLPLTLSDEVEDIDIVCMVRTSNPSYRAFGFGKFGMKIPPRQEDLTVVGDATVDWDTSRVWRLFLSSANDPFALTLLNPLPGETYILKLVQGVTPVDITYPVEFEWLEGSVFELSTTASGVDILVLYYDGVSYWAHGLGASSNNYLDLNDTTDTTYTAKAYYTPRVNVGATGLELVSPAALGSQINLTDLADVVTSTATGEILYFDGAVWRNIVGATWSETYLALTNLSNVTAGSPSSGHVLQYNGSAWVNVTPATIAGSIAIDNLSDVVVTTPVNWNILVYSGGNWVNTTPAAIIASNVALDDLSNVYGTTGTPAASNILRADGAAGYSIATIQAMTDAYVTLGNLLDVAYGSLVTGDVLFWNGSYWQNVAPTYITENYVALNNLSNVASAGGEDASHILRYSTGAWSNVGIAAMTEAYVVLDNLNDVTISGAAAGHVLVWNGSAWVNAGIAALTESYVGLTNLSDCVFGGSLTDDMVLRPVSSVWTGTTIQAMTDTYVALNDLNNVTAPSPVTDDVLTWDGAAWINQALSIPASARSYASSATGAGFELTTGSGEVLAAVTNVYVPSGYYVYVFGKLVTRDHDNSFFYSQVRLLDPSSNELDSSREGNNDDDANTYSTVSCLGQWFNAGGDGVYAFSMYVQAFTNSFAVENPRITAIAVPV